MQSIIHTLGLPARALGLGLARWCAALTATLACALAPTHTQAAQMVTLGAEDDAAPWSYADGSGYVNDVVRAAFTASGWQVRFEKLPYSRCKLLAIKGQLAGCFSASETPALREYLLYPKEAVFVARNVLLMRSDAKPHGCSVADWGRPLSVGLVNGYEYVSLVDALMKGQQLHAEYTNSEAINLRKLAAGRIDAALITVDEVKRIEYVARRAGVPNNFKAVCDFGGAPAYVAFSRSHALGADALQAFDRGMTELKKSGTWAKLQKQWAAHALNMVGTKAP